MRARAKLEVINGGYPEINHALAEAAFYSNIRALQNDRSEVHRSLNKRQKRLMSEIIKEINRTIQNFEQYSPREREFAGRIIWQTNLLPPGYNETMADHVLASAELTQGRNVLEIGFGPGRSFGFFSSWNYLGVETSPYMIYLARQKDNAIGKTFRRTEDGKDFPAENGSIDFVLGYNSFHQIKAWQHEMDECTRVLAPRGRIYVVERNDCGQFDLPAVRRLDPGHNRPEELAQYLESKGLETKVQEHIGTYFGEVLIPDGRFRFTHVEAIKR